MNVMTKKIVVSLFIAVALSTPAVAQDRKTLGWIMVGAGTGATIAAFNYSKHCPAGSRSVTVQNPDPSGPLTVTYCIEGQQNLNIYTEPTMATFARPALAWIGLSVLGTGAFLALLPKKAPKVTRGLEVGITPTEVFAAKTFAIGRN